MFSRFNKMSPRVLRVGNLVGVGLLGMLFLLFPAVRAQTKQQNLEELRKRGYDYLEKGSWEPAQTTFENALKIAPKDTLSIYGNALALFN